MYCECGTWVETDRAVTSVKCDNCSYEIYDIPAQKYPTRELNLTQYYLLVANNGFLLLTKWKLEAIQLSKWKGIIFSGIVDRSKHSIVYEIGETEHREKLRNIPISKPYSKDLCFDFHNLKQSGSVKKVSIEKNGKSKFEKPVVL